MSLFGHAWKIIPRIHVEVYLSKYFEVINNHTQQLVDLVYFEYKVRPKPK